MSQDKDKKKKMHDWRPFVGITDVRKAPFSDTVYCQGALDRYLSEMDPPNYIPGLG